MSKGKYVAYISSYTQGDSHGIRIYDVDMKNGRFKEKDKVEITNSSYLKLSVVGNGQIGRILVWRLIPSSRTEIWS